jgi:hypothetical protein
MLAVSKDSECWGHLGHSIVGNDRLNLIGDCMRSHDCVSFFDGVA